ncbi:MAG: InlB B-repeat-containing protein, partial [Christensenellales bacterium]
MKKKILYWVNGIIIGLIIVSTVVLAIVFSANTHKINYYDCGATDQIALSGTFEGLYPKKHRNGTDTFLNAPTKTGYSFEGWFENYNGTGNRITKISAENDYKRKINLYAKWKPETYAIIYK